MFILLLLFLNVDGNYYRICELYWISHEILNLVITQFQNFGQNSHQIEILTCQKLRQSRGGMHVT